MVKINCTENNGVNRTEVEVSGEMTHIVSQICYAIANAYTEISKRDKRAAKAFREMMVRGIADEGSPVWSGAEFEDATCSAAIVRKGVKLTGDDIADLLRRGTPTHIVKALLDEMEV